MRVELSVCFQRPPLDLISRASLWWKSDEGLGERQRTAKLATSKPLNSVTKKKIIKNKNQKVKKIIGDSAPFSSHFLLLTSSNQVVKLILREPRPPALAAFSNSPAQYCSRGRAAHAPRASRLAPGVTTAAPAPPRRTAPPACGSAAPSP